MKSLIALAVSVATVGQAVGQWRHEVVQRGLFYVDGFAQHYFVTNDGVPVYSVEKTPFQQHVFKGHEDLNEKYLGANSSGAAVGISRSGHVAWAAQTPDSYHSMVDGHDFFVEIYGKNKDPNRYVVTRGTDDQGRGVWFTMVSNLAHVYRGTEELSAGMEVWVPELIRVNDAGDVGWTSYTPEPGGYYGGYARDVFLNHTNVSKPLLPATRTANSPYVDDTGHLLWNGTPKFGQRNDIYLDSTNLTGQLTDMRGGGARGISPNGQNWIWLKNHIVGDMHFMLNYRDLNNEVFGTEVRSWTDSNGFVNDRGDVFWSGGLEDGSYAGVFVNTTDVSTDALGVNLSYLKIGMDRFGNGVWYGRGPKTNGHFDAFVNSFNLSADALSDYLYRGAKAAAVGFNGEVLWWSENMDETFDLWLSTPVPEPSTAFPLLALLPLLRTGRRRCRRSRA